MRGSLVMFLGSGMVVVAFLGNESWAIFETLRCEERERGLWLGVADTILMGLHYHSKFFHR